MKPAEMEALIIAQGEKIEELLKAANADEQWSDKLGRDLIAAQTAHMHLVQRVDNIVEGFKQELTARDEGHKKAYEDFQQELADRDVRLADYSARIAKLETLVLARNASAATKRNMTDEDALRVLTGDLREVSHKDAAEKIGLTYAQVYSCRLEFTFKHVHKDLRDNVKEWKNPWSK